MPKKIWFSFLLVAVFLSINACQTPRRRGEEIDWSKETRQDLDFIRQKLRTLHPAFVVKPEDPERAFLKWFDEGYQIALRRASVANTFAGYYFTLRAYTVGFEDEHLLAGMASLNSMATRLPTRWPGFTLKAESHHLYVGSAAPPSRTSYETPPLGAELLDCDGENVETLLQKDVFPYYGNERLEKNWKQYAPRLFVDLGNPLVQLPKRCRFKTNGQAKKYDLQFDAIQFTTLWQKLNPTSVAQDFSLHSFKKDWQWVRLPGFSPDDKGTEELRSIIGSLAKYRNEHIVIDLRGNTGGSSSWGTAILESLYTKKFIDAVKWNDAIKSNETYEYRVSKDAAEYFKNLLGNNNKNIPADSKFFTRVSSAVQHALEQNIETVSLPLSEFEAKPEHEIKNPLKRTLLVITDEHCFSACLSFMDLIRAIPQTIHIGKITSADAVFMQELNEIPLANGDILLTIPTVRIHNRRRGHNEPYIPQIVFDGDISDTSALEKFVSGIKK